MSVYSGFATRQQEGFYFKMIEKLIQILSGRLLEFFTSSQNGENIPAELDRHFAKKVTKLHKTML